MTINPSPRPSPSLQSSLLAPLFACASLFGALPTAHAQQLPNGGSVDGAITTSGGVDTYTFTAQAGHGYQIRLVDQDASAFYPVLTVLDPAGQVAGSNGDVTVAAVDRTANLTGTYQVRVADGNTTPRTGRYRIHFARAPGANEGGRLPNGGAATGVIERGDLDSYTFSSAAGESYQLRFVDTDATGMYPTMRLYGPTGRLLGSNGDVTVAELGGEAPESGIYTVMVGDGNTSPAQTGNYALHFARMPGASSGGALTSGAIVSDQIERGELDSYTFRIQAGESFQLRASDTDGTGLYVVMRLYDPRGCIVASNGDARVAALLGTAGFSGDYTVLIADGNTSPAQTGRYDLHFAKVPGATSGGTLQSGGSVTGHVGLGEIDSYSFDIVAGENYQLRAADLDGTALYVTMRLYDPRGTAVSFDGDGTVAALGGVAAFTGRYTVIVADGNTSPAQTGAYRLYYSRLPGQDSSGPLQNGGVVRGALDRGELESFTLELAAGQGYMIRLVDSDATGMYPTLRLYDPRGSFVASDGSGTVATLVGTARFTGTYHAVVADGNTSPSGTGAFAVHLTAAAGANEHGYLLDGITADGTLERGDLDSYTFRARAGDSAQVSMTDTLGSAMYPSFRVYAPSGQQVTQDGDGTTAVRNFTVPFDGTFTIVAYDGTTAADQTGPYTLRVTGTGRTGNSGCDREGTVILSGATSATTGFAIAAPDFVRTCTSVPFVAVGLCNPSPLALPNGFSCGTCGLTVVQAFALEASPLLVPPLSSTAVGATVCVQALCTAGPCITFSAASAITITP